MKLMCFQCRLSRGTWCRKEQLEYHVTTAPPPPSPHLKQSVQFWISVFNKTVSCDTGKGKEQLEKPPGLNILVWSCLACVSKCVWGQWSHFNASLKLVTSDASCTHCSSCHHQNTRCLKFDYFWNQPLWNLFQLSLLCVRFARFVRAAVTLPDHLHRCCHRHHHGISGFHLLNPLLYKLPPLSFSPFLQIRALNPLLPGPLPIISPRLQSGCRLPPPGVGVRSWGTHLTNPWRMMRRGFGPRTLSRASRKLSLSTHHVAAGKSSSLMKARCTVRSRFFLNGIFRKHRNKQWDGVRGQGRF